MANNAKLSGFEMMVQSLMRAAGFDPAEMVKDMTAVVDDIKSGLRIIGDNLTAIKNEQAAQRIILNQIVRDVAILKADAGIIDVSAVPLIEGQTVERN